MAERSARELLAEAEEAHERDSRLLAKAQEVTAAIRRERLENHWGQKVAQLFQGNAPQ